ncbi:unnamed protein product [Phytophthora fragariaefolia]|uniref:Unnamed protein product n=1 Tax=Phytophthora fragariaefolia TaxID=1490495 RepID=A0A9W7D3J1_9STRA|nr:unnamed protein product [Phytophthora fragariaefolia]
MTTEALEAKAGRVVLSLERKAELKALNKIPEMLYTCEKSADIRRNSATIGKQSAENSAERTEEPKVTVADEFVLSEDGLLYRHNKVRRPEELGELDLTLRLVMPTTMIDEVPQNCHNSIEGGHHGIVRTYHRLKADYYWISLYADVVKHVQSCEDCSTSKSKPHLKGYSPGNVMSARPFHVVSMDFVIPQPRTRRGNTALLLFQDHFTGFVIAKAMSATGALEVAKAFEECVFRRFGAPSLIRHDRDPRFMSEVFQKFSEMMQSRSRAALSYRPQANGQQERSVKTMIQRVRTYVEDPLQADWDAIAEKLVHAINNSRDSMRQESPCYLVHGWDARSTLKVMTESTRQGQTNSAERHQTPPNEGGKPIDKAKWLYTSQPSSSVRRRQGGRKNTMKLLAESRTKRYREALSRQSSQPSPRERQPSKKKTEEPSAGSPAESTRSLFKEGDQV